MRTPTTPLAFPPTGKPGPPGPPGPPGAGALVVPQATPAGTWIIPHTLGRRPLVAVYDASGAEMIADVLATDTSVTVMFAQATAGSAVLV